MARRFLPAWLLMALIATSAMLPTAANAQSISRLDQGHQDRNAQRGVSDRAYANSKGYANAKTYTNTSGYANTNGYVNSNSWGRNRVQSYRQPPQLFHRFSQERTRQRGAYQRSWHDD